MLCNIRSGRIPLPRSLVRLNLCLHCITGGSGELYICSLLHLSSNAVGLKQGGTICGAIEESSRSLKSIDKRVFINFRDKYAVFTNFRDKYAVFTHFRDKMPYLHIFATKMTFLKYMTKTQCLVLILSVQDRINQLIANLFY